MDLAGVRILVLNAGSSSLKSSVIETPQTTIVTSNQGWGSDASRQSDRGVALERALTELASGGGGGASFDAVGHRVVHGGTRFTDSVLIDDEVIRGIEAVSELAPLHNGVALETVRAARERLPSIPHVASFDTAFHWTLPPAAVTYPVPAGWTRDWGVRRFGFHGLSVAWSVHEAARRLERPVSELGILVAHLGSGCSVTAVWRGESVSTSMGMTPLEGLMMGTRSGSVDPGMLLQLLIDGKLDAAQMRSALEHESGLLGVSGLSGEMEKVVAAASSGSTAAQLAVDMFVRRGAEQIAAAATSLPRVDALVFTGGIGEHASGIRDGIVERLATLRLDGTQILVIEAREDLTIAAETERVVGLR
jgi:acetate kinase